MAAAIRTAGTAYVKLDGNQLQLGGTLTIQPWSAERAGVAGLSGITGYKETPIIPYIEVEMVKDPNLSLALLASITNSTVTAETADGTNYVLSNAWSSGQAQLDAAEGKVTVKFEGLSCDEFS